MTDRPFYPGARLVLGVDGKVELDQVASPLASPLAERVLEIVRSEPGIASLRLRAALDLVDGELGPVAARLAAAGLVLVDGGHFYPLDQRIQPFTASMWSADNYPKNETAIRAWRIQTGDDVFCLMWGAEDGWRLYRRRCSGWRREWIGHGPPPAPGEQRKPRAPHTTTPALDPRRSCGWNWDRARVHSPPPPLGDPHKIDPLAGIPYSLWVQCRPVLGEL